MSTKSTIILVVSGFAVLFIGLPLLFGSWVIIDPGQQGIKVTLGKVDNNTLGQGFHWKLPYITSIEVVSIQTQTDKDSLSAASKDLQNVSIETNVTWHVQPNKVMDVFQQYHGLKVYNETVIAPDIRDAIKAVSAKYTAEELVQKRDQFASDAGDLIRQKLEARGAIFEGVAVVNFEYSPEFTKAIEAKVVAEQDALAAKNKLAQVQFEADQRVAEAQGEAKAIAIQAAAIQTQGGAEYIKLKAIEKWDGKYPQTVLGSAVPLINIQ